MTLLECRHEFARPLRHDPVRDVPPPEAGLEAADDVIPAEAKAATLVLSLEVLRVRMADYRRDPETGLDALLRRAKATPLGRTTLDMLLHRELDLARRALALVAAYMAEAPDPARRAE